MFLPLMFCKGEIRRVSVLTCQKGEIGFELLPTIQDASWDIKPVDVQHNHFAMQTGICLPGYTGLKCSARAKVLLLMACVS